MDKNRYETQKHIVEINLEDAPQQFFTREDLHWLFTQVEKVEKLENELTGYKLSNQSLFNVLEKVIKENGKGNN